MHISIINRGN